MGTTATMNPQGRITIPAKIRTSLRITGETPFDVEARDGGIFLRPAMVIPREDTWAYTPEESAAIERARQSPAYTGVTSEDLETLITASDPAQAVRELLARLPHYERP